MKQACLKMGYQWPDWYGPKRNSYIGQKTGEPCLYPVSPNKGFIWGHHRFKSYGVMKARGTYVVLPQTEPIQWIGQGSKIA